MRIYFDTEFSSLWVPQLISVGMAAEDGQECYVELMHDARLNSAFTSEIVMPLLDAQPVSRTSAANRIRAFLSTFTAPELVCDFIGDWWLLLELIPELADHAIPKCARHYNAAPVQFQAAGLRQHNALDDARMMRLLKPALQDA